MEAAKLDKKQLANFALQRTLTLGMRNARGMLQAGPLRPNTTVGNLPIAAPPPASGLVNCSSGSIKLQ